MDFGYRVASAILTISQKKIVAPLCKFAMSRRIVISQAYADNYCGSFKTQKIYEEIRRDMEQAHLAVGLPLQDTWTSKDTEPGVTKRLGLPDGLFMMLGFVWDLIRNMLSPQDYLNLYGKHRGKSKCPKLSKHLSPP